MLLWGQSLPSPCDYKFCGLDSHMISAPPTLASCELTESCPQLHHFWDSFPFLFYASFLYSLVSAKSTLTANTSLVQSSKVHRMTLSTATLDSLIHSSAILWRLSQPPLLMQKVFCQLALPVPRQVPISQRCSLHPCSGYRWKNHEKPSIEQHLNEVPIYA